MKLRSALQVQRFRPSQLCLLEPLRTVELTSMLIRSGTRSQTITICIIGHNRIGSFVSPSSTVILIVIIKARGCRLPCLLVVILTFICHDYRPRYRRGRVDPRRKQFLFFPPPPPLFSVSSPLSFSLPTPRFSRPPSRQPLPHLQPQPRTLPSTTPKHVNPTPSPLSRPFPVKHLLP